MRKSKTIKGATSGSGASAMDQAAQAATDALRQLAQAAEDLKQALTQIIGTPGGAGANPGGFAAATSALASVNQATSDIHVSGAAALQTPNVASVLQMASADSWGSITSGPASMVGMGGSGRMLPPRDALGRFTSVAGMGGAVVAGAGMSGTEDVSVAMAAGGPAYAAMKGMNQGAYAGHVYGGMASGMQQDAFQTLAFAGGAAAGYTNQVSGLMANQIVSGRTDPMSGGSVIGGGLGAVVGGALGLLTGNPLGVMAGMGIGGTIGSGIGAWIMAPFTDKMNAVDAQRVLNNVSGDPRTLDNRTSRFDILRGNLGDWATHLGSTSGVSVADVARGYSSVEEGMLLGGLNPFAKSGTHVYGITDEDNRRWNDILNDNRGMKNVRGAAANAIAAIHMFVGGREELGEAVTRRGFERYRNRAPDVLKDVGQIYGEQPETGDNMVDRILKYGPTKAIEYDRLQNDAGTLPMSERDYYGLSADVRRAGLLTRRAGLQARGSGSAMVGVLSGELDRIGGAPGGRDSTAYAETAAKLRDARALEFHQGDILAFSMTHLQGQLDRANVMPGQLKATFKFPIDAFRLFNLRKVDKRKNTANDQQYDNNNGKNLSRQSNPKCSIRIHMESFQPMNGQKKDSISRSKKASKARTNLISLVTPTACTGGNKRVTKGLRSLSITESIVRGCRRLVRVEAYFSFLFKSIHISTLPG